MYKEHNNNTTKTTTHDITWFTPSLGVTSTEMCFIQLFTKTTVLICALSYRSLQVLKAAHTAVGLYAHSCRFPLSPKTLYAHSCRGRPRTQLGLNLLLPNSLSFTLIHLTSKA